MSEGNISVALGNVPQVHAQRAFKATVTITGVGLGQITLGVLTNAIIAQHQLIATTLNMDQYYIHEIRAYGSTGGYLSLAPYPHKQWAAKTQSIDGLNSLTNFYFESGPSNPQQGFFKYNHAATISK